MEHEKTIRKILSNTLNGYIKSRESNTVEFKESYHKSNAPKYAKIMASFSNNRGGYIIFGITDKQRRVKGLSNNSFENLSQEGFTDVLNSLFSPSIEASYNTLSDHFGSVELQENLTKENSEEEFEQHLSESIEKQKQVVTEKLRKIFKKGSKK